MQPQHAPPDRRLARARLADEAERLPGADRERHVGDRLHRALHRAHALRAAHGEVLDEMLDLEDRRVRGGPRSRSTPRRPRSSAERPSGPRAPRRSGTPRAGRAAPTEPERGHLGLADLGRVRAPRVERTARRRVRACSAARPRSAAAGCRRRAGSSDSKPDRVRMAAGRRRCRRRCRARRCGPAYITRTRSRHGRSHRGRG